MSHCILSTSSVVLLLALGACDAGPNSTTIEEDIVEHAENSADSQANLLKASAEPAGTAKLNKDSAAVKIVSVPITQGAVGATYRYLLEVEGGEGEVVAALMKKAPPGMSIAPVAGSKHLFDLTWLPVLGEAGEHKISIAVHSTNRSRNTETSDQQDFSLRIEETCATGQLVAVWLANDETAAKEQHLGFIQTYTDQTGLNLGAAENYNYRRASGETVNGPALTGGQSQVFAYEESGGDIYINFHHNIDNGSSTDNRVYWDLITWNNSSADRVVHSDDGAELKLLSAENGSNFYEGRFRYASDSDGGVIGPFRGEDFTILIKTTADDDNIAAQFFSSEGITHSVSSGEKIRSFLLTFQGQRICEWQ